MIKHIVFFKLEDNSQAHKQIVKEKLMSLKDKIDVLKTIEVGCNFSLEERAFDLALITDFDSCEDLSDYNTHPAHLEFVNYVKQRNTVTKVVDYEY